MLITLLQLQVFSCRIFAIINAVSLVYNYLSRPCRSFSLPESNLFSSKDTLDRPLGVFRIGNRRLKKFEASWPSVRISLQTDVASLLCVDPLPSFS